MGEGAHGRKDVEIDQHSFQQRQKYPWNWARLTACSCAKASSCILPGGWTAGHHLPQALWPSSLINQSPGLVPGSLG